MKTFGIDSVKEMYCESCTNEDTVEAEGTAPAVPACTMCECHLGNCSITITHYRGPEPELDPFYNTGRAELNQKMEIVKALKNWNTGENHE